MFFVWLRNEIIQYPARQGNDWQTFDKLKQITGHNLMGLGWSSEVAYFSSTSVICLLKQLRAYEQVFIFAFFFCFYLFHLIFSLILNENVTSQIFFKAFSYLQVPLFLYLPWGSWSHQFGLCLQQSGRHYSRKVSLTMGCWKNLYLQLQRQCHSCCLQDSGLNSSWASEHGWGGNQYQ